MVNDPGLRIKSRLLWLFPVVADQIVPFFESVRVVLEVGMLAPPFEASNRAKTILECPDDGVAERFFPRIELDPEVLNMRCLQLVDFGWCSAGIVLFRIVFISFFFALFLLWQYLNVSKKVKVFFFRLSAGWR